MEIGNKNKFNNPFGISFADGPEDWELVIDNIVANIFKGIEISGHCFDDKLPSLLINSKGLKIFGVRNMFPSSFTGSIADQPEHLIKDFIRRVGMVIRKLSSLQCDAICLDFALETAFGKEDMERARLDIVKEMAPVLYKHNMILLLPVRIPPQPLCHDDFFYSFLNKSMCGQIRFSLDLHPHETTKDKNLDKYLKWFRFDTNMIRFIYEPEAGNMIVEKVIETWMQAFSRNAINAPLVFCPKISDSARYIKEIKRLEELILGFGKKNE